MPGHPSAFNPLFSSSFFFSVYLNFKKHSKLNRKLSSSLLRTFHASASSPMTQWLDVTLSLQWLEITRFPETTPKGNYGIARLMRQLVTINFDDPGDEKCFQAPAVLKSWPLSTMSSFSRRWWWRGCTAVSIHFNRRKSCARSAITLNAFPRVRNLSMKSDTSSGL